MDKTKVAASFKVRIMAGFLALILALVTVLPASAISRATLEMYALNNILGYDDKDLDKLRSSYSGSGGYRDADGNCIPNLDLDGNDNVSAALGALLGAGYSLEAAAAILGNLQDESYGLDPTQIQGGEKVSEDFVAFNYDKNEKTFTGGFGIAQWTFKDRVRKLQEYADNAGLPVSSLEAQVGWLIQELGEYGYTPSTLNQYTLEEAVWEIYKGYEKTGQSENFSSFQDMMSKPHQEYQDRLDFANEILSNNGDTSAGGYYDEDCNNISGGSGGGSIADAAIRLAWPYWGGSDGGEKNKCDPDGSGNLVDYDGKYTDSVCRNNPKPAYQEALDKFGISGAKDCGHFVAAVIYTAGVDSSFPKTGSDSMISHMRQSALWERVDLDSLEPGDVVWKSGHILIYVGSMGGKWGTVAQASQGTTVGVVSQRNVSNSNTYEAYRFAGGSMSGSSSTGMSTEDAEKLMEEYRNLPQSEWDKYGINSGKSCLGGMLSNCVSFVKYFLNRYTSLDIQHIGNGGEVVSNLINNYGLEDGGTTPKPFAIFSTPSGTTNCGAGLCGHTGVVLGVDEENDKILIGEAGCSAPATWTGVHEKKLSDYTNGSYKFAYTDTVLDMD